MKKVPAAAWLFIFVATHQALTPPSHHCRGYASAGQTNDVVKKAATSTIASRRTLDRQAMTFSSSRMCSRSSIAACGRGFDFAA
jgi:hypothetical protein